MHRFIFCFVLLLAVKCFPQDSTSQGMPENNYYLFNYVNSLTAEHYNKYLDSIKQGKSNDYFTLRMAYTKTASYNPYSVERSLQTQRINEFMNDQIFDSALVIADSILSSNYTDIDAHLLSAYVYNAKNDTVKSAFHYDVCDKILGSIYQSGDGQKPETAFIVINTDEEYSFLRAVGLKFKKQELVNKDNYSFDLLNTTGKEESEEYNLYFNITLPMTKMGEQFKK